MQVFALLFIGVLSGAILFLVTIVLSLKLLIFLLSTITIGVKIWPNYGWTFRLFILIVTGISVLVVSDILLVPQIPIIDAIVTAIIPPFWRPNQVSNFDSLFYPFMICEAKPDACAAKWPIRQDEGSTMGSFDFAERLLGFNIRDATICEDDGLCHHVFELTCEFISIGIDTVNAMVILLPEILISLFIEPIPDPITPIWQFVMKIYGIV
jgi:hypothetical protein